LDIERYESSEEDLSSSDIDGHLDYDPGRDENQIELAIFTAVNLICTDYEYMMVVMEPLTDQRVMKGAWRAVSDQAKRFEQNTGLLQMEGFLQDAATVSLVYMELYFR
jgi:hypothetical protein